MSDADAGFSLSKVTQGYGPLIGVLLAIIAAAFFLPMFNAVADAPAIVTQTDLARLRALPAVAGSAESGQPAFASFRGRRGTPLSPCKRDHVYYGLAQFLHLPQSQLRRLDYSLISDCRLRQG